MKSVLSRILTATSALILLSGNHSDAAKVTLDGTGHYRFTSDPRYYVGVDQSGRYDYLGADYYRKTVIGMRWITNRSLRKSGPLSIEFWGMPYYGADTGVVLMTKDAGRLRGRDAYRGRKWQGWSLFLDEYRYPEINLWEFRRKNGWKFRDALSFRKGNVL